MSDAIGGTPSERKDVAPTLPAPVVGDDTDLKDVFDGVLRREEPHAPQPTTPTETRPPSDTQARANDLETVTPERSHQQGVPPSKVDSDIASEPRGDPIKDGMEEGLSRGLDSLDAMGPTGSPETIASDSPVGADANAFSPPERGHQQGVPPSNVDSDIAGEPRGDPIKEGMEEGLSRGLDSLDAMGPTSSPETIASDSPVDADSNTFSPTDQAQIDFGSSDVDAVNDMASDSFDTAGEVFDTAGDDASDMDDTTGDAFDDAAEFGDDMADTAGEFFE
jgi:hypothetical protein